MTVDEVYKQARQLSAPERQQLLVRLLDEIALEPPDSVRSREHLMELLEEGMRSPVSAMTAQDWNDIRSAVRERSARRKVLPSANA